MLTMMMVPPLPPNDEGRTGRGHQSVDLRLHPLTLVQRLNDALIAGTRADGSKLTAQRGSLPARWSGPEPRATDRPDPPLACGPGPRLW